MLNPGAVAKPQEAIRDIRLLAPATPPTRFFRDVAKISQNWRYNMVKLLAKMLMPLGASMKRLLLTSVAFCALIGAATAADQKARPLLKAPPPAPVQNWSGCYVGVEGGGAWGRSHHTGTTFVGDVAAPFDMRGYLIGGTYGC